MIVDNIVVDELDVAQGVVNDIEAWIQSLKKEVYKHVKTADRVDQVKPEGRA